MLRDHDPIHPSPPSRRVRAIISIALAALGLFVAGFRAPDDPRPSNPNTDATKPDAPAFDLLARAGRHRPGRPRADGRVARDAGI